MKECIIFKNVVDSIRQNRTISIGNLQVRYYDSCLYQIYDYKCDNDLHVKKKNNKKGESIIFTYDHNFKSRYLFHPNDDHLNKDLKVLMTQVSKAHKNADLYLFLSQKELRTIVLDGHNYVDVPNRVIDLGQTFNRIKKVIDYDKIKNKTVCIVGLGSGGSRVAVELAKSGINNLILIDYDTIKPVNLSRHVCGIKDLGRLKINAVKDYLENINQNINITIYNMDIIENVEKFEKVAKNCDLIVAASGAPQSYKTINEISIRNNVPTVYAGVWEKAIAGYVMRVIPGKTACFNCVHEIILKNAPSITPNPDDYVIPRGDALELKSEPGLSIDIGLITLLQARMCILTLQDEDVIMNDTIGKVPTYLLWFGQTVLVGAPKVSDTYENISQDYLLWTNREYKEYGPFSILRADVPRRDNCAVCNEGGWLEEIAKQHGLDMKDLSEIMEEIDK